MLRLFSFYKKPLKTIYLFSYMKNSLEKFKVYPYQSIKALYNDLRQFQQQLDYTNTLKYTKLLEDFNKKILNLNKKQEDNQSQDWWKKRNIISFFEPLNNSKTYEHLYKLTTQSYKPAQSLYKVKSLPIQVLYQLINKNHQDDLNYFYDEILKKPKTYSEIYSAIRQRMENFQHYFCMLSFEGYKQFYCRTLQKSEFQGQQALQRLYKKQAKFQQDFKFIPQNMQPKSLQNLLSMANILIKYNFCSQRIPLFSQRVFMDQNISNKLTSQSIRNNLYILGYCKTPVLNLDAKLFHLFDRFSETNQNQQIWWPYQLLFYMLANHVQHYTLFSQISEIKIPSKWIHNLLKIDKQILYLMSQILVRKYGVNLINQQGNKFQLKYEQIFDRVDQSSQIVQDFLIFLEKHNYPYSIDDKFLGCDDMQFMIQDKNYLCLNSDKFLTNFQQIKNKKTAVNGRGQLILQYLRAKDIQTKIINTPKILEMKKFTKKEQYLRTKMKGVRPLKVTRQKKYQI